MSCRRHTLRQSPLRDRHEAAGAKLVPFAGWEMPVQYEGVRAEHVNVRTKAGMFDVSHMGEVRTSGPEAEQLLQRLLSNDLSKLAEDGAQYSVLCNEEGGVLDDLFTYRLDGWLVPHRDQRLQPRTRPRVDGRPRRRLRRDRGGRCLPVRDARRAGAPGARRGGAIAGGALPNRMRTATIAVAGEETLVCGTGYTGEDGVELLMAPAHAPAVWDALLGRGVKPAGLGARDTLRLEACFHLYGNDLSTDRNPIEAGLGWICKLGTGFIGADALEGVEPEQNACAVRVHRAGHPAPGQPREHPGG